ncbi:MAG: hypothetical protein JSV84_09440 [Gemmatimonadota bacterium]|nr:MAG: hypothetical protein JSV84_09440 [Gemmatimonadota bacterium]
MNSVEQERKSKEITALICQLQGVLSAHVSFNGQEELEEIHVLANRGRSPKQIVRDIESILVTQRGLRVDHKKISVAQIEGESTALKDGSRIKFVSVGVSVPGLESKVEVELTKDNVPSLGVAEGPGSELNQLRLVVEATLKAIRNFLDSDHTFVFESIKSIGEERNIIIVTITALTPRDERKLIGCAFSEGDRNKTAVFATLDALNRYLERWLKASCNSGQNI